MDRTFTCPQGHRWDRRPSDRTAATCPECGAAAVPDADSATASEHATTRHSLVAGYQLLGQAGIGDVSVVFKARDLKRDRLCAVKVLRCDDQSAPSAAQRFRREMHGLASFSHPNIVWAYEAGVSDGVPYIVMEYLEGGSLARKLNGSALPPREAAQLVEALAGAVHYANGRGLIHRNLKPQAVLFAADGTPKLIDFGLAHWLNPDQGSPELKGTPDSEGAVVGTPSYMAPEQAAGQAGALGPATDVYGLGAVLYECLTGRPPFLGATVMETLRRVGADEPVPPRSLNRQADAEIEGICLRCLRKAPRDRYATARDVAEALRRYRGEPRP